MLPTITPAPIWNNHMQADATVAKGPPSANSETLAAEGPEVVDVVDSFVPFTDRLPFNMIVVAVTFLNILVLGLEMDFGPGPAARLADRLFWLVLQMLFCIWFAIEMVIRIWSGREGFFRDVWNVLDFCLVCAACIDTFALQPAGTGGQIRFFTVLRALRAVRLVRLVRHFHALRELWLLVGGLVNSVKALGWVGLIVLLVLYVCSIVVTAEIGQNDDIYDNGPSYDGEVWPYKKYFGSIFNSMFTLFQVMTLDGWCDDIVRHVVYRQPLMGIFFVLFLFFTAFGLMNIVVGIIVENTLAAAHVSDRRVEERTRLARKEAVQRLHDILSKSDAERTGEISLEELRAAYQSRIVQEQFDKIGLTLEEAKEIFKLLDFEQRGRVELKRFADSCRELVGGAKRRDLAQVEVTVGALAQHLERLDVQFARIEGEIGNLTDMCNAFVHGTVRVLTGFDGSVQVPPRAR